MADRSEPPSPRSLRAARSEGRVARSPVLSGAIVIAGSAVIGVWMGPAILSALTAGAEMAFSLEGSVGLVLAESFAAVARAVAPALVALAILSLLAALAQVGWVWSPSAAWPRTQRLSGAALIGNLRAGLSPGRLAVVSVTGIVIGAAGVGAIRSWLPEAALLATGEVTAVAALASRGVLDLCVWLCVAAAAAGVVDFAARRRAHLRSLKLTREEAQRERREEEGDATHAAARRRLHTELSQLATLEEIGNATLLIAGAGIAAALRYEAGSDEVPLVLAAGRGWRALKLTRAAEDRGIPIADDGALAKELEHLAPGAAIPESTYAPVAEWLRRTRPM